MPAIHHGTPGGSLVATGASKYGSDARVGAWFEVKVAQAIDRWLSAHPEPVHVFHDLSNLTTTNKRTGRKLSLGTANIDHVILTGGGWIMIDAKRTGLGRLTVQRGHGVLIDDAGEARAEPWMDDRRSYSRAGCLYDLTGLRGVAAWVLPDGVDYDDLAEHPPLCMSRGGTILSISELAAGELESQPGRPYLPAAQEAVEALSSRVSSAEAQGEPRPEMPV